MPLYSGTNLQNGLAGYLNSRNSRRVFAFLPPFSFNRRILWKDATPHNCRWKEFQGAEWRANELDMRRSWVRHSFHPSILSSFGQIYEITIDKMECWTDERKEHVWSRFFGISYCADKIKMVKGGGKGEGKGEKGAGKIDGWRVERVPHISHLLSDPMWWSNVASGVSFADLLARLMSGSDGSRARTGPSIGRPKWQVRHSPAGQLK